MKKISYLFLALLLPGLIFVFLKYAGKNKFDVPVYFEGGVDSVVAPCTRPSLVPYLLPDSLWPRQGINRRKANLIIFPEPGVDFTDVRASIDEELGMETVLFIDGSALDDDSISISLWRTCIFMLNDKAQAVLADSVGRIRGYYDLHSRDEMDRMRVELKIVLHRY